MPFVDWKSFILNVAYLPYLHNLIQQNFLYVDNNIHLFHQHMLHYFDMDYKDIHQFVSYIVQLHNLCFYFLEKILAVQLFEQKNIFIYLFPYNCMKNLVDYLVYMFHYLDMVRVLIHMLEIHNVNFKKEKQNQNKCLTILFFCFYIPVKFDEHSQ